MPGVPLPSITGGPAGPSTGGVALGGNVNVAAPAGSNPAFNAQGLFGGFGGNPNLELYARRRAARNAFTDPFLPPGTGGIARGVLGDYEGLRARFGYDQNGGNLLSGNLPLILIGGAILAFLVLKR